MKALMKQLRDVANGHDFDWPGGYSLVAIMQDGGIMCCDCVRENLYEIAKDTRAAAKGEGFHGGWELVGFDILWEGPEESCDNCNKVLPTEYGNPESEECDE